MKIYVGGRTRQVLFNLMQVNEKIGLLMQVIAWSFRTSYCLYNFLIGW